MNPQSDVDCYLIYVYSIKVHFHDGYASVGRVLNVTEPRVSRIDVGHGDDGGKLPLVAPAAVKVWADPLYGAGRLVGA